MRAQPLTPESAEQAAAGRWTSRCSQTAEHDQVEHEIEQR